jgi:tRNA(fMet)-specific endonuclease VapC
VLVLDTNHVSELGYATAAGLRLRERLLAAAEDTATTIVSVEEQLRGWLAEIHRLGSAHQQIPAYRRLQERVQFFAAWVVLPWDDAAADLFVKFRRQGFRIGSMDLKIACIALVHDATLLTRNTSDFTQVPGLRVANWLD